MKKLVLFLIVVGFIAGCSSPKYTYNFGTPKYYSDAKKPATLDQQLAVLETQAQAVAPVQPETVIASTQQTTVVATPTPLEEKVAALSSKYQAASNPQLSKTEQKKMMKELKADIKEVQKEFKSYTKKKDTRSIDSVSETNRMDKDLKLALILLAVGTIMSWIVWPLGAALCIVGLVFLIIWLMKQ